MSAVWRSAPTDAALPPAAVTGQHDCGEPFRVVRFSVSASSCSSTHVVVGTGPTNLGSWIDEEGAVLADHRAAIGGPAPARVGLACLLFSASAGEPLTVYPAVGWYASRTMPDAYVVAEIRRSRSGSSPAWNGLTPSPQM